MWNVMIADDEPLIREGLEKLIDWKGLGCELVYIAENGQLLLEEIKRRPPDILIADIRMPLMTGLEVAQFIYEQHMNIQVIILTAYADFQYAHEAIRCQVSDYIVKTSALEDIPAAVEKITAWLEKKRLASYRMLLLPTAAAGESRDSIRRFMRSAFESWEYHPARTGTGEICMIFTMCQQDTPESMTAAAFKFSALCKSFLGSPIPVLISSEYEDSQTETSVYAGLLHYWKQHEPAADDSAVHLVELPSLQEPAEQEETFASPAEEDDLLGRIEVYVQGNYTKKITLDDISEAIHANRSYLSRLYKQRTGKNLFDEINGMRVEKAKELIRGGRRRIYEIAGLTGFDDTAYFSRVFKKYTGQSPKEYEASCHVKPDRRPQV